MSHLLRQPEAMRARPLTRLWAAVPVTCHGEEIVVQGEPFIAKVWTSVAELPDRFTVLTLEGEPLLPTPGRKFYITVETIDPYHAVLEM